MASSVSEEAERSKSVIDVAKCNHFKPITLQNLMYYYIPMQGAISYTSLSLNVMYPNLLNRLLPKCDLANLLLCGTLVGTGFYIYDRRHLKSAPMQLRVGYSVFGAILFSLGSVLFWAISRSFIPRNAVICSAFGMCSGLGFIKIGSSYLDFIDSNIRNTSTE